MIIGKEAKPGDQQTTGIGNNGGNGLGAQEEVACTQNCSGVMGVCAQATVRRLTPLECERLMDSGQFNPHFWGQQSREFARTRRATRLAAIQCA